MPRFVYIYITVWLATALAWPQATAQVVVKTQLDSTAILIGEQAHLRATVSVDAKQKVTFPAFADGKMVEGVEMLEVSAIDTTILDGGKRWELSRTYTITSFDSAVYTLPPLEVKVDGGAFRAPHSLALKVSTVAVDMAHPDEFRDPHGPTEAVFTWEATLLVLSFLVWGLLAVAIALLLYRSRRKPMTRMVRLSPPTPPHERAIAAIRGIRPAVAEQEDVKRYYMELTDALRTYIFERFHFNAREMTTDEIIHHLTDSGEGDALYELQDLLQTADLVKFARYEAAEGDRALMRAVDYVNTTKSIAPPAPDQLYRVEVLAERRQRAIKLGLEAGAFLAILGAALLTGYIWWMMWLSFA